MGTSIAIVAPILKNCAASPGGNQCRRLSLDRCACVTAPSGNLNTWHGYSRLGLHSPSWTGIRYLFPSNLTTYLVLNFSVDWLQKLLLYRASMFSCFSLISRSAKPFVDFRL